MLTDSTIAPRFRCSQPRKGYNGLWLKLNNQSGTCRRKLHLVVDASTGEIAATDLTGRRTRDCARVPVLLGQINDPVASVVADGAYDALVVYGAAQAKGERQAVRVLMPAGQAFLRWESRANEPGLGPGESLRTSVLGRARPHKGGTLRTELDAMRS